MGFKRSYVIIFMILSSLLSSIVVASDTYNPKALDALFYHNANQTLMAHRKTGSTLTLTQIPLPSNFSGINVSIIRLRSRSLWRKGINSSFINFPPRVITLPYVKRLAIVYHNLGNWSSKYYQVPGYSLVSPIIGFNVYDSSNRNTLSDKNVTLNIKSEPISIHFPNIEAEDKNVTELKCVRFGEGGGDQSVEIKNITERNVCVTRTIGRFCVVVATPSWTREGRSMWKWWVIIGCVSGALMVVVLILAGIAIVRTLKRKKMESMEKESERGVALDTFWVGGDKMPSASVIRTQPMLEHDYVP